MNYTLMRMTVLVLMLVSLKMLKTESMVSEKSKTLIQETVFKYVVEGKT